MTGRTTAEDTLSLAYDDDDRLSTVADATSTLRSYGYDAADRLTQATDAQAKALSFGYDDDSNLTTVADDRGQSAIRGFDSRGNLASQADGRGTISYAYDELNRISSLTDPSSDVIGFGYDDEGNLTSTELPNGVTTSNSYDGANRMTETESVNGSNILQHFDYVYDAAGNRSSATDRNNDQTTYGYDALNRLTEWDPPSGPAVGYGYDAAGNRTSAYGVTYDYNALNQLVDDTAGTTYGYDDAGRLVSEINGADTKTYEWDALDQLIGFDDGTDSLSYSYDALGRRADRNDGAVTETAHYGDFTDVATVDTDAGGVIRDFVTGPTGLVEQHDASTADFPLPDAHGDVTASADTSGTIASRQDFGPWGEQLAGTALEMGWLGAQERRTDPSAELVQMGVRAYEPSAGRFISEDPMLGRPDTPSTLNRMGYALGQPIDRQDLDGRCVVDNLGFLSTECDLIGDVAGWTADTFGPTFGPPDYVQQAQTALLGNASHAVCDIVANGLIVSPCSGAGSPSDVIEARCSAPTLTSISNILCWPGIPEQAKKDIYACTLAAGTAYQFFIQNMARMPILLDSPATLISGGTIAAGACAVGSAGEQFLGVNPIRTR